MLISGMTEIAAVQLVLKFLGACENLSQVILKVQSIL